MIFPVGKVKKIIIVSLAVLPLVSEKAMAPQSSTHAWKIPWTEEPGELLSMELHRIRHD